MMLDTGNGGQGQSQRVLGFERLLLRFYSSFVRSADGLVRGGGGGSVADVVPDVSSAVGAVQSPVERIRLAQGRRYEASASGRCCGHPVASSWRGSRSERNKGKRRSA